MILLNDHNVECMASRTVESDKLSSLLRAKSLYFVFIFQFRDIRYELSSVLCQFQVVE
jgi:hypothetical protein